MEVIFKRNIEEVQDIIDRCQYENHIQQVAFSSYHKALTQICFTCNCVRSNIEL